jgi:hypothetical protein
MTVFIAYAPQDRAAAEALEKVLERRGWFVELETGERGFRPVQGQDAVVALWSKDTVFSPYRFSLEKRTLEAWADEHLVFIKLDHAFSPVGLRDLKAIDASFEPQRDIAWAAAAKSVSDILEEKRRPEPPEPLVPPPSEELRRDNETAPPAPAKRANPLWLGLFFLLMVALVLGTLAWWASKSRLGLGAPLHALLPIGGPLLALVLMALAFLGVRARADRKAPPAEVGPAPRRDPHGSLLFISYAHADAESVLALAADVQAKGRSVWIDKDGIKGGAGWAGEIVRAIRASGGVVVMCSPQAFESDHVKRELYLADRYKKPLLPVFVAPATPPEDFEYFVAGLQWIALHEKPAGERAAAILAAAPA